MTSKVAIEKVLHATIEKIEEEVGGLLGAEINLLKHKSRPVSKEEFFSEPRDYSVVAKLDVSGGVTGTCYLILDLKAAITLGSTLVMLPQDLINKRLMKATLEEEEADAFGEVANIIAGAYSHTFLKHFPNKLHFKKIEVKSFVPEEIDLTSEDPLPQGKYYLSSSSLTMKGKSLGQFEALFPFDLLDYQEDETSIEIPKATPDKPPSQEITPAGGEEPATQEEGTSGSITVKDIERTLQTAIQQTEEELGRFLGQEITFAGYSGRVITKQAYLAMPRDYSVATTLAVSGDATGRAYAMVDLKSAITLGGTLILLPPETIAKNLRKAVLEGEEKDAFGEIANLIAGTFSQVFPRLYPRKIRFVRTEVETFIPEQTDAAGETPFPPDDYYFSSCTMKLAGKNLGQLDLLIPLAILGYTPPQAPKTPQPETEPPANAFTEPSRTTTPAGAERPLPSSLSVSTEGSAGEAMAAIIADDSEEAKKFVKNLTEAGYLCKNFTFDENFNEIFASTNTRIVFLVMKSVGSQGLAAAIKIRSALKRGQPIIAAGPQWTRSNVIKAIKYGATDILITPAEAEEILQKAGKHMAQPLPATS